jgi:hypothetical protein
MGKKSEPLVAEYQTRELAGDHRLILELEDERLFGVELPEALSTDEPLPGRAELEIENLDETGVPQGAKFLRFIVE